MSLWDWAAAAYARPGAAEACLELQDRHGQCVSYLLWAAWAGEVDADRLAGGAALARGWERATLAPLRGVRRGLKAPAPPIPEAGRQALRERVREAELAAERLLLEALEQLGPPAGGDRRAALRAASAAWGPPAPETALADLALRLA